MSNGVITKNGCLYFKPNTKTMQKNNMIDITGTTSNVSAGYTGDGKITLGSGDTAPTIDDYAMDSVLSNLTLITEISKGYGATNSETEDYGDPIATNTATYRNDTNANIEVKEIGLIFKDTWYNRWFLIYREVLDTPVIIEPNHTKSFSVTIS